MSALLAGVSDARLYAAGAIALLYFATSAYFLRPRRSVASSPAGTGASLIVYASQTGFAEELAGKTAQSLAAAGPPVRLIPLHELSESLLNDAQQALFVVSTTGEGDAPDRAAGFVRSLFERDLPLSHLKYAVLALGDRDYANFCAFGHRIDRWLRHQGATALFDTVEVDDGDEAALRHWQHQLSVLGNSPDLPDWQPARYERWTLIERRLLNPGSAGASCYHIELRPESGPLQWTAGDIAEIDPLNSTWTEGGAVLPHREYSIASLPSDGALHLLVRQMRRPQGEMGLGSGWLTEQVQPGHPIALRIRINSAFHPPQDDRPLILIGNGTGLAGLRSLLKSRRDAGRKRNWLLFGERNAATDRFYGAELDQWTAAGWIERMDLVFSRDAGDGRYVQHRLEECADRVRAWVENGAAIYVCGSLQGMAPGVDAALKRILGAPVVEDLAASGRYCRDVY